MIHYVMEALHFAEFDPGALAKCLSLLVLPFASEDLAFIFGGFIVVNQLMPVGLVAASIYGGIVASDFVLYGIGAGARRIPWLSRFAVDDNVESFTSTFKRNMFGLVVLCRVVPGVFIALIACGWARVPLTRFMLASLIVSALYLPLMLYLVVVFGDALDDHVGLWTWPFLLGVVALAGFVRNRVFSLDASSPDTAPTSSTERPHQARFGALPRRDRRARAH